MVIVHPYEIVMAEKTDQVAGKLGVDVEVGLPRLAVELAEVEAVVEHGPQRMVGEALVVTLVVGGRQIDGRLSYGAGDGHLGLARAAFGNLAAPAEP